MNTDRFPLLDKHFRLRRMYSPCTNMWPIIEEAQQGERRFMMTRCDPLPAPKPDVDALYEGLCSTEETAAKNIDVGLFGLLKFMGVWRKQKITKEVYEIDPAFFDRHADLLERCGYLVDK